MVQIVPIRTFEVLREGFPKEHWRFQRGQIYELIGISDNLFDSDLCYLYLGDWDHCYLVEKKDIKILC